MVCFLYYRSLFFEYKIPVLATHLLCACWNVTCNAIVCNFRYTGVYFYLWLLHWRLLKLNQSQFLFI